MTFEAQSVKFMSRVIAAVHEWGPLEAAAAAGNGGEESGGFKSLQEIAPPSYEGVGGFGWFQWTYGRRTKYLAWCTAQSLDPRSDDANIGYFIYELIHSYSHVILAVKAASTLQDKVSIFEQEFEVPANPAASLGVRLSYANRALAEWQRLETAGLSPDPTGSPLVGTTGTTPVVKPAPVLVPAPAVSIVPVADTTSPTVWELLSQVLISLFNYAPKGTPAMPLVTTDPVVLVKTPAPVVPAISKFSIGGTGAIVNQITITRPDGVAFEWDTDLPAASAMDVANMVRQAVDDVAAFYSKKSAAA